jgi:S1-C subfamily serine protease
MPNAFATLRPLMCNMKSILLILWLASTASAQWTWAVSPQPTLAPHNCPCVDCKCNPCDCHAKSKPVVSVVKRYTPAEASVIVQASKGKEIFQASGTAISDTTVISCWHVLDKRDGWQLTVNNLPAKLLRSDSNSDVALLSVEGQLQPVKVAGAPPKAGEAVTAYGYEWDKQGQLWRFPANIVQVNRYRGFPNISTRGRDPVKSGRSGGGLFNAGGELVGVCSAADGQDGLYCGFDAVQAIIGGGVKKTAPKFQSQADPLKFVSPDLIPDPKCPDGQCPLIKKQSPTPKASPEVKSGAVSVSPAGGCSSCGQRSYSQPVRRGLFGWRR